MGTFRVNGREYADCDKQVAIIPLEGKNANVPFVLETASAFEYSADGDSEGIGQTGSPAKTALVPTEAKAEWKLTMSMGERFDLTQHIGPGGARVQCAMKVVWQRKGLKQMVVESGDGRGNPGGYVLITKGLIGAKTDNKSAPTTEISGNATDWMENGISCWSKPPT